MEGTVEFIDEDGGATFQCEEHPGEKINKVLGPSGFFFVEAEDDLVT